MLGAMDERLDIALTPLIALEVLGIRMPLGVMLRAPWPIIDGGRVDNEDIRLCRLLSSPFDIG